MNTDLFDNFSIILQKNHKCLNKLLESFSGKTGLNASSIICLKILNNSADGKTSGELCEICCYDKALISRNIKELIKKGYIKRNEADAKLKRGYRLVLTDKGVELTEIIENNLGHFAEEITRDITDDDIRNFYDISLRFTKNLGELVESINDTDYVPTQNL